MVAARVAATMGITSSRVVKRMRSTAPFSRFGRRAAALRLGLVAATIGLAVVAVVTMDAAAATKAAAASSPPAPTLVDSDQFLARELPVAPPGKRPVSARVAGLLAQMTLREKVGQMTQLTLQTVVSGRDQDVHVDPEKIRRAVVDYGVGSILNCYDQALPVERWHELLRDMQAAAAQTRLKVPVLYGIDTIHGANYVKGATLFPQPLGMAATWNPELMLAGSKWAAAETRAAVELLAGARHRPPAAVAAALRDLRRGLLPRLGHGRRHRARVSG